MFNGPGKLSEIMRCFEGRRRKSQYWLNRRAKTGRKAVRLRILASDARMNLGNGDLPVLYLRCLLGAVN
jgi:hypothetical protein